MKMMFPIVKIQDIFTNEEKKMLEIYRFIYFFVLSRRSLPTMIGCKKKIRNKSFGRSWFIIFGISINIKGIRVSNNQRLTTT